VELSFDPLLGARFFLPSEGHLDRAGGVSPSRTPVRDNDTPKPGPPPSP